MSNWKNFRLDEFKCKHCGENRIEHELIDKLQLLREDVGFPFLISSGYRCKDHPAEVNKNIPGTHAEGIAVDIACSHTQALKIVSAAEGYGFTGLGVNQKGDERFIHLDISKTEAGRPRPHIWSY
jgi:zinc D-Ala-D-Ala carboxypeptidase